MIFNSLKRILGNRSKSTTRDSTKGLEATGDVMSGVSILQNKIKHLNKFRRACDEAGLEDDLKRLPFQHTHSLPSASPLYIRVAIWRRLRRPSFSI